MSSAYICQMKAAEWPLCTLDKKLDMLSSNYLSKMKWILPLAFQAKKRKKKNGSYQKYKIKWNGKVWDHDANKLMGMALCGVRQHFPDFILIVLIVYYYIRQSWLMHENHGPQLDSEPHLTFWIVIHQLPEGLYLTRSHLTFYLGHVCNISFRWKTLNFPPFHENLRLPNTR